MLPLIRSSSVFAFLAMAMLLMVFTAESRYLRPSDHGLEHQSNQKGVKSPEMKSFFGAEMELPKAKNSSKPWWRNTGAPVILGRENSRRDRMRKALLISSLVCGVAAVVLMVATAFIYFFHRQRQSSSCKQNVVQRDG